DTLDFRNEERISARTSRMEKGQFGDIKALGGGLYESRFFFGSGYRVYFGEHKGKIILLLNGGDKATQRRDIAKAKEYWLTYLEDRT
ncbi:MAG: type II toxin-antitoxin system RelE/ParE family toxin, partial [Candidatus Methylacidiphilales bacterium]